MQLRWVAEPPGSPSDRSAAKPSDAEYAGPPAYPTPPRWGFPALGWRRALPLGSPGERGDAQVRMRAAAGTAVPALFLAAALSIASSAAEAWRYVILLDSRDSAVSDDALRWSDALVNTAGVLALLAGAVAVALGALWLVRGYQAAADDAGVRPARPQWQLLVGMLVPGVNLVLAGVVLTELEHAALEGSTARRPRPSRLVSIWWALWAGSGALAVITVLWGLRESTQAQADTVFLHVVLGLLAAGSAVCTVQVVRRLTTVLSPTDISRPQRWVLVRA